MEVEKRRKLSPSRNRWSRNGPAISWLPKEGKERSLGQVWENPAIEGKEREKTLRFLLVRERHANWGEGGEKNHRPLNYSKKRIETHPKEKNKKTNKNTQTTTKTNTPRENHQKKKHQKKTTRNQALLVEYLERFGEG